MIQVIVRALDIMEFVAKHGKEPVQLFKIAEHVGLSRPTTANIVKTLLDKNYLEQLGRKKGYRLGIAAYQLTGNPSYQQHLITAAKAPMEWLSKQLNENCILGVIGNHKRVILHMSEGNQMLNVKALPVAEVYATSIGRLLMAYQTPKERENLIKVVGLPSKNIWPGAETKAGLEEMLQQIRKEAFAQTYSIYHTVGFAVPVYQEEQVVAGLSIFVPESRYTELHKENIAKLIRKAAQQISEGL